MVKWLLLLRHAKSSWDDPDLDDLDRPLSKRGLKTAPMIGRDIGRRGWLPDRALVSTAVRTRETWQLASREWQAVKSEAEFSERIYEAGSAEILREIRATSATVGSLLVVGHNPGLEDLATELAGDRSDPQALRKLMIKFPTAALARFEFDGDWATLEPANARLTHFLRPKDIA